MQIFSEGNELLVIYLGVLLVVRVTSCVAAVVDCKECERKWPWPGGAEVHDNE